MKRKSVWIHLGILSIALLVLCGYRVMDLARTDKQAPQILIDDTAISVSVSEDKTALMQGITAWDDRDGDVTDSLIIESVYGVTENNRITVTYAAVDRSGNVAKVQRKVHFVDYKSPRFTLSQPLVYEFSSSFDVIGSVGAEDVFDGDIQRRIKATMLSSGTTVTEEGTHEVQFRVTNSVGDTSQLILPVEVYPVDSYNAQLILSQYLIYLPQGSDFDKEDYLLQLQIPNETISLHGEIPEGMYIRTNGTVDTRTPGVYTVTYTARYAAGSRTYTGYTKLFVVVEG